MTLLKKMPSGTAIYLTGASGFIGSHLARSLRQSGVNVLESTVDLKSPEEAFFEELISLRDQFKNVQVVHLGGLSHVPSCERNPHEAYQVNTQGSVNLGKAVKRAFPGSRLIFASTAQVYEASRPEELATDTAPWDETRSVCPQNLYAKTKWEAELGLNDISRQGDLDLIHLRLFNHTHHTQPAGFFLPSLYQQLLSALPGGKPVKLRVGNLELHRDIGAIQDLLECFDSILAIPSNAHNRQPTVLNICSGVTKSLSTLAIGLATKMGCSVTFEVDSTLLRAVDPRQICGSNKKVSELTGWRPTAVNEDRLLALFFATV